MSNAKPDLNELARRAVETPSLDAPVALAVLTDALLEAGEIVEPPMPVGRMYSFGSEVAVEIPYRLTIGGRTFPGHETARELAWEWAVGSSMQGVMSGWLARDSIATTIITVRSPRPGPLLPETDAELRERLHGYWSPWAEGPSEDDILTATGSRLDAIARNSYGMPRR